MFRQHCFLYYHIQLNQGPVTKRVYQWFISGHSFEQVSNFKYLAWSFKPLGQEKPIMNFWQHKVTEPQMLFLHFYSQKGLILYQHPNNCSQWKYFLKCSTAPSWALHSSFVHIGDGAIQNVKSCLSGPKGCS